MPRSVVRPRVLCWSLVLLGGTHACGGKSADSAAPDTARRIDSGSDAGPRDPGGIPVHVGDVELRTDAEVALLEGIETIQGSVALHDGVTDLSPLAQLTTVTGSLRVEDTTTLADLSGLSALTSIGGTLGVRGSTLPSLAGLDHLTSVAGLQLEQTATLDDLSALARIDALSGNLVLVDTTLASLHGLERLTEVGGYLNIQRAPALTSLAGLSGLRTVGKTLFVVDCDALPHLDDLEALESVGESLSITDLPLLTTLQLPVRAVADAVQVARNPQLTTVSLPSLTTTGELELHGNARLTELTAPQLVEVAGWLQVDDNDALVRLGTLPALATVDGRVSITRNDALTSLADAVPGLRAVGENFDVHDNPSLPACEVDAVAEALTELGGTVVNTGNLDSGGCD